MELKQNIGDRHFKSLGALGTSTGADSEAGYGFVYDFTTALQNEIIRPSTTPAVFELRNPNTDIYGRVI